MHMYAHMYEPWFLWDTFLKIGRLGWKIMHVFKLELGGFCLRQDKTGVRVEEPPKTVWKGQGEPAGWARVLGVACQGDRLERRAAKVQQEQGTTLVLTFRDEPDHSNKQEQ